MPLDQSVIDKGIGGRISELEKHETESFGRIGKLNEQEVELAKKEEGVQAARAAAVKPVREAGIAREESLRKQAEALPKEEEVKDFQRPTMKPEEVKETFSLLMVASMLVGATSRTPYNNIMNAMTGAMQGFMKGDKDKVDEALKIYDKNLVALKERNASKRHAIEDAWKKYANEPQRLASEIKLIAGEYDDQLLAYAAQHKSLSATLKMAYDDMHKQDTALSAAYRTQEMAQAAHERMLDRAEKKKEAASNMMKIDPEGMKVAAYQKLMFGTLPPGMGNASAAQRAQVYNAAAEIGKELGLSPMEQAMLPTDNKIKMKAVEGLTKWGANLEKSAEQVTKSLDLAISYAKQITPSDIKHINKLVIAGEREFGSGPAAGYGAAMQTVQREYGRLMMGPMSNAMLPVEAMKATNDLISTADSLDALNEISSVMRKDAKFTVDAVKHQVDSLRGSVQTMGREGKPSDVTSFATEAEAEASGIKPGTRVMIGGKMGTWK